MRRVRGQRVVAAGGRAGTPMSAMQMCVGGLKCKGLRTSRAGSWLKGLHTSRQQTAGSWLSLCHTARPPRMSSRFSSSRPRLPGPTPRIRRLFLRATCEANSGTGDVLVPENTRSTEKEKSGAKEMTLKKTVYYRVRVIKGTPVIYHAPNHPIPKSMSPFLYRKLPKVNRSPEPWWVR